MGTTTPANTWSTMKEMGTTINLNRIFDMTIKNTITRLAFLIAAVAVVGTSSKGFAGDHDHDHGDAKAGPNGGRVLHKIEPHLEFLVTKDRRVQITALDDKFKATGMDNQVVRVTAGNRSNPIRMKFVRSGDVLISETAFPTGNNFPVVVQLKGKPGGKTIIEKFTLNLTQCPTCEFLEYACTCDHGHSH